MIGGIIILALFLTALTVMVFVSQQYDAYQGTLDKMNQNDIQAISENLVAVFPGLSETGSPYAGSGCSPACYEYYMTISNMAGIGTQIARIYINSTLAAGSHTCTSLCVLNAASPTNLGPFRFLTNTSFVNPSEFNHVVILLLNTTSGGYPASDIPQSVGDSTITIVTTRGRVFSFQWEWPQVPYLPSGGYIVTGGDLRVAYQGTWNSKNEPGSGGSGGGYCHSEPAKTLTATGIPGGSLYFMNPWLTQTIFFTAFPTGSGSNTTTVYIFLNITNTRTDGQAISIADGNLILQVTVATSAAKGAVFFVAGSLFGVYYPAVVGGGTFYQVGPGDGVVTRPPSGVPAGSSVILIFRMNNWNSGANTFSDVVFTGTASITNGVENSVYWGTTVVPVNGLYVRPSC